MTAGRKIPAYVWILLVIAAFAAIVWIAWLRVGQSLAPKAEEPRDAVDIVLVVVDTERADYTSVYGAKKSTTPFLKKIATDGIRFTRAFAPAPWTAPSMYSLFTGYYPTQHGITGGSLQGKTIVGQGVLPPEAVTLAEYAEKSGYTTFGVNTNFHLIRKFGFAQGFDNFVGDKFYDLPFPNVKVFGWINKILSSQKYFLWIHYFDPHFPYVPRSPWFEEWQQGEYSSYSEFIEDMAEFSYRKENNLNLDAGISGEGILEYRKKRLIEFRRNPELLYDLILDFPEPLLDNVSDFLSTAYMTEIRDDDKAIGMAFKALGAGENTFVIYTSDHGEELLDHGQLGHRNDNALYQELLHVPLIIHLPGGEGAGMVIDTPVSLVDIVPTVLDYLDAEIPEDLPGRSLLSLVRGGRWNKRTLYAEVIKRDGRLYRTIIEYPWKYIMCFDNFSEELYNLDADPVEKDNLSEKDTARAAEMKKKLEQWTASLEQKWEVEQLAPLSQEEIERLRSMGYIGGNE